VGAVGRQQHARHAQGLLEIFLRAAGKAAVAGDVALLDGLLI
jgi:hypothetical protein